MKRIIALLMAIMLVASVAVFVTGCGTDSDADGDGGNSGATGDNTKIAQETFNSLMTAIKAGDIARAGQYLDNGELITVPVDDLEGGEEVMNAVFSSLEYQTVSFFQKDSSTVEVIVNVTTLDLTAILGQCMKIVMAEYVETGAKMTDEELDAKTEEVLKAEIGKEGLPTRTSQVKVDVKKIDNVWKVQLNPEFQNAISGGLIGSIAKARQDMTK